MNPRSGTAEAVLPLPPPPVLDPLTDASDAAAVSVSARLLSPRGGVVWKVEIRRGLHRVRNRSRGGATVKTGLSLGLGSEWSLGLGLPSRERRRARLTRRSAPSSRVDIADIFSSSSSI